jgi:hypothetical protein
MKSLVKMVVHLVAISHHGMKRKHAKLQLPRSTMEVGTPKKAIASHTLEEGRTLRSTAVWRWQRKRSRNHANDKKKTHGPTKMAK